MATIAQVRVDFRLLHGQVVTKWRKYRNLSKCIIVDNALADDEFMTQIYTSATPAEMCVKIYSEDKAVRIWEKNQYGEGNVLLLFNSVSGCLRLAERGVKLPEIQLGGLPGAPGKINIAKAVSIGAEEFQLLEELHDKFGIKVYAQMTPEDTIVEYEDIRKKIK